MFVTFFIKEKNNSIIRNKKADEKYHRLFSIVYFLIIQII